MRKFSIYAILIAFAALNIFGSCEEDAEKRSERYKKAKRYFTKYVIYDNIDSTYTDLSVFVGEIDGGHKYRYHIFNGKNKSQMVVEHLTDQCKACKKAEKK